MWQEPSRTEQRYAQDSEPVPDRLDRALVAGLLLEAILGEPELPPQPQVRQRLIKRRLSGYLVEHLAGRISLDRFRTLARNLDHWFAYYYPLLAADSPPLGRPSAVVYGESRPQAAYMVQEATTPWLVAEQEQSDSGWRPAACREEALAERLQALQEFLPKRSHAKLTVTKLKEFFWRSAGGWFRLRDFERFLQIDRKTAWDYLQQFLQWGLLCHNRRQSAAVRYCLNPALLKVEADTLRLALALVLAEFPEETVEAIGDLLVASGGAPFPESHWQANLPPGAEDRVLEILLQHEILTWRQGGGGGRLLQLHRRWRQVQTEETNGPPAAAPPP